MKRQLYFPRHVTAQVLWLANFRRQLIAHATKLQLTPEEVESALADLDWLLHALGGLRVTLDHAKVAVTAFTKELMSGKGAVALQPLNIVIPPDPAAPPVKPGALKRLFNLIRRIKFRPKYEASIGLALGIEGNHYRTDSPVPTFKLKLLSGDTHQIVEGRFSRYGRPGVWVECQCNGGDWEALGIFTGATFQDTRPLQDPTRPEIRAYRLRYWDAKPFGDWTDVAKITVSPA